MHLGHLSRLPAEFEPQAFVQLIFPHARSDWAPYLDEACRTFTAIARAIARYEPCVIVCDDVMRVRDYFENTEGLLFVRCDTDDTWARDCSGITLITDRGPIIQDFAFTGWGGKFEAAKDNAMTIALADVYDAPIHPHDFVLEGGAIESNGRGVLLTTEQCLLNPNRHTAPVKRETVETKLKSSLGINRILWLASGYLAGDDTDSHIDTLARFCDPHTICYVQCKDRDDEHFEPLSRMQRELEVLRDNNGKPFRLAALPMPDAIYFEGERLPATYANFLIINDAVLVPTYADPHDDEALEIIASLFPEREIIGIDCRVLIRQHGSLHCVTMQFPEGITLRV